MNRFTLAGAMLAGFVVAPVAFATSVSFDVINRTGATLTAVYTGPSGRADWGPNILEGRVKNGATVSISLEALTGCEYDFLYEFSDRGSYEEYEVNVCAIDGAEFVIK